MSYSKGDMVSVLDEDITGTVVSAKANKVTVETEDGFLLDFDASELVRVTHGNAMLDNSIDTKNIAAIVAEKESVKRKTAKRVKPKERAQHALEVDLHINKLVPSTKGMSNYDMLNLQLETAKHKLEFAMAKRIQRLVFIHGVGEGVLKLELETLLRRYDGIKFYEANYQKYGLGATEVYFLQN